jgi:hypothetical protein
MVDQNHCLPKDDSVKFSKYFSRCREKNHTFQWQVWNIPSKSACNDKQAKERERAPFDKR